MITLSVSSADEENVDAFWSIEHLREIAPKGPGSLWSISSGGSEEAVLLRGTVQDCYRWEHACLASGVAHEYLDQELLQHASSDPIELDSSIYRLLEGIPSDLRIWNAMKKHEWSTYETPVPLL